MLHRFGILALLALSGGLFFVAGSVAMEGTGERFPSDAIQVRIPQDAPLRRSPVGDPVVFAELKVTKPGTAGGAVEQSFTKFLGEARLEVAMNTGRRRLLELPPPGTWRGTILRETRQTDDLRQVRALTAEEAEGIRSRMAPPYLIVLTSLRRGDRLMLQMDASGDEVERVWPGDRERLEAYFEQQEAMRYPVVVLMGVMGLVTALGAWRLRPQAEA